MHQYAVILIEHHHIGDGAYCNYIQVIGQIRHRAPALGKPATLIELGPQCQH